MFIKNMNISNDYAHKKQYLTLIKIKRLQRIIFKNFFLLKYKKNMQGQNIK
jgi:hypothetical protein